MATVNPFDLLDDDAEEPSQIIQAHKLKVGPTATSKKSSDPTVTIKPDKLPSKAVPPSQAVREAKNDMGRGGRGFGRGYGSSGRGGGLSRDINNSESPFTNSGPRVALESSDSAKISERRGYSGLRNLSRGTQRDAEPSDLDRPHRAYERRSGTGRGHEFKREGAGRANWGTLSDDIEQVAEEIIEAEKTVEKPVGEEVALTGNKESNVETEVKVPEDTLNEMTLEEYGKVLEEKRKALKALKIEERKVDADKEFGSMQLLSNKKNTSDALLLKLVSDKRKEIVEKDEKSKKSLSINEFLKPLEGEKHYNTSGRGGRGAHGLSRGGFGSNRTTSNVSVPKIEDPGQFPTLGGK